MKAGLHLPADKANDKHFSFRRIPSSAHTAFGDLPPAVSHSLETLSLTNNYPTGIT
jgi:hypothetical protein